MQNTELYMGIEGQSDALIQGGLASVRLLLAKDGLVLHCAALQ